MSSNSPENTPSRGREYSVEMAINQSPLLGAYLSDTSDRFNFTDTIDETSHDGWKEVEGSISRDIQDGIEICLKVLSERESIFPNEPHPLQEGVDIAMDMVLIGMQLGSSNNVNKDISPKLVNNLIKAGLINRSTVSRDQKGVEDFFTTCIDIGSRFSSKSNFENVDAVEKNPFSDFINSLDLADFHDHE